VPRIGGALEHRVRGRVLQRLPAFGVRLPAQVGDGIGVVDVLVVGGEAPAGGVIERLGEGTAVGGDDPRGAIHGGGGDGMLRVEAAIDLIRGGGEKIVPVGAA